MAWMSSKYLQQPSAVIRLCSTVKSQAAFLKVQYYYYADNGTNSIAFKIIPISSFASVAQALIVALIGEDNFQLDSFYESKDTEQKLRSFITTDLSMLQPSDMKITSYNHIFRVNISFQVFLHPWHESLSMFSVDHVFTSTSFLIITLKMAINR